MMSPAETVPPVSSRCRGYSSKSSTAGRTRPKRTRVTKSRRDEAIRNPGVFITTHRCHVSHHPLVRYILSVPDGGHAFLNELKWFAERLNPSIHTPIYTNSLEQHENHFANVLFLEDVRPRCSTPEITQKDGKRESEINNMFLSGAYRIVSMME